jgi:hypothetical protein
MGTNRGTFLEILLFFHPNNLALIANIVEKITIFIAQNGSSETN